MEAPLPFHVQLKDLHNILQANSHILTLVNPSPRQSIQPRSTTGDDKNGHSRSMLIPLNELIMISVMLFDKLVENPITAWLGQKMLRATK